MQPNTGASSSMGSLKKYDVFISFRGEDTRKKFTSYLYDALLSKNVQIFIDENELKKGDEISTALIEAIEDTHASIVVFSENYASSKWCLNELVKILECKKDHGQIVIPVFYEVDPSHIRKQNGSYGQAFQKHEQDLKHNKDKLQKWRNALTEAANLSGWHSQNYRTELDFIKDIVEDVYKKVNHRHQFEVDEELVGIEKKNNEVESLMEIGSKDVKTLALWGMGGIGKTTLAKHVYGKQSPQFQYHCFLENVREKSTKCGLSDVRKLCFSKLFELPLNSPSLETPNLIRRLAGKKSLIVLDDVATLAQVENFNIFNKCLGPGSRLMLTTRDKEICSQFDECKIYEVEGLDEDDSLQLFCWNAFQEKHAKVGYEELVERTIRYCRGNPLALKVLGANFRRKSKEVWESELEKLKKIPNGIIHDVLRLSFDDLDRTQQDIFLDIACFFGSRAFNIYYSHGDYLTILLEACNFFPISGIEVLLNKALITRSHDGSIEMHDLLVEMGREIVNAASPKDPGRRSRLWHSEDVYDVLKYNKGTEVVEVISFDIDISKIGDLYLSSDSFKSMIGLRYLRITYSKRFKNRVHFPEGLEWLSDKLRYLHWDVFPLKSLPLTFCAERLVVLTMTRSKLRKLWDGIQKLDTLVEIDLEYSDDLIEIPDLSKAPNLQIVNLSNCMSLRQLHPSVFTCPKLRELNLHGCTKIKSLKTDIHSKSLQKLILVDCSSLVEFSVTSEEMTWLSLRGTAIHELPSSIWRNSKLEDLILEKCEKLNIVEKKLSTDLGLRSLTYLRLSGCTEINTFNLWFILDGMQSLGMLDLRKCCNLETLPDNFQNISLLKILRLDECRKLKSLPKLPTSLRHLAAFNCTYLVDTNILHRFHFNKDSWNLSDMCYLPGGQIPCEFDYQTTKASIDIPPIPKSGLCGFIFCIILSKGFNFRDPKIDCTIYEHGKEILHLENVFVIANTFGEVKTLILDHVLFCSWSGDNYKLVNMGNQSDRYNLSFEFKLLVGDRYDEGEKEWSTKGIKGCGVIPVYDLEHSLKLDVRSISRDEIVEDEPDIDESVEDEFTLDDLVEFTRQAFGAEFALDKSDIIYEAEFDIYELIHQAIGAEFDFDECEIIHLLDQINKAKFDIDESDIIELIHQAIGAEFDIDKSEIFELVHEIRVEVSDESEIGAQVRDQQKIILPKEKEALLMIMKLKLEALPMKLKMNIKKLIAFFFVLVITLLFLQRKMKMNINKLICRGSTKDEEEENLNDKSSCACSIGLLLKHLLEESKRYFSSFSSKMVV